MPIHPTPPQRPERLTQQIADQIRAGGGWLPFDDYMHLALYTPGLGYYASGLQTFGRGPADGSDFITAPELSPLFGRTLAVQIAEALEQTGTHQLWEFGAGSGALAGQLLDALQAMGQTVQRYHILDVSGSLQARQRQHLQRFGQIVHWISSLPDAIEGVIIGNEVLDAMPVKLLARRAQHWHERGVCLDQAGRLAWADRPTTLRPPHEIAGEHDYLTEIHPQARAFIRTLASALASGGRGAAFFLDYGFPEAEYYHWQRSSGTLMCHRLHQMDDLPLQAPGEKDITAHVNFTDVALTAQDGGLTVLGYTSQGRFLLNCGLAEQLATVDLRENARAGKLVNEHEMGELFKAIGLATGPGWLARGFASGDRSHRL